MSTTASPAPATDDPHFPGRERRWPLAWAAIGLLATAVVGDASIRRPTGPDDGTMFCNAGLPKDRTLNAGNAGHRAIRIGTFNIHGGKGLDGHRDMSRIAARLEGLDFVGLNEVHGAGNFDMQDDAEALGRLLQTEWLFAPTEHRWWHDHFGNGALAKCLVRGWQRIPLASHGSKSSRNALLVTLDIDGRPLRALVTHIDRGDPQRCAELRTVINLFLALGPPAVLLGDLNTTRDDPLLQTLLATPGVDDPLADSAAGKSRIDWIVSRGLKCTASGTSPAGASDHPCFWAEFVLENGDGRNGEWGMRNGE